jgi:hypothetical protein
MRAALFGTALAFCLTTVSPAAFAQCSGWPVNCTGIHPSNEGGGGNFENGRDSPRPSLYNRGLKLKQSADNRAANCATDADQTENDRIINEYNSAVAIFKEAIAREPHDKIQRATLAMTYAELERMRMCKAANDTAAGFDTVIRYYAMASELGDPHAAEAIASATRKQNFLLRKEELRRKQGPSVCNSCAYLLFQGLDQAAHYSQLPRQFVNNALAGWETCSRNASCSQHPLSEPLLRTAKSCLGQDDAGMVQCLKYGLSRY